MHTILLARLPGQGPAVEDHCLQLSTLECLHTWRSKRSVHLGHCRNRLGARKPKTWRENISTIQKKELKNKTKWKEKEEKDNMNWYLFFLHLVLVTWQTIKSHIYPEVDTYLLYSSTKLIRIWILLLYLWDLIRSESYSKPWKIHEIIQISLIIPL